MCLYSCLAIRYDVIISYRTSYMMCLGRACYATWSSGWPTAASERTAWCWRPPRTTCARASRSAWRTVRMSPSTCPTCPRRPSRRCWSTCTQVSAPDLHRFSSILIDFSSFLIDFCLVFIAPARKMQHPRGDAGALARGGLAAAVPTAPRGGLKGGRGRYMSMCDSIMRNRTHQLSVLLLSR